MPVAKPKAVDLDAQFTEHLAKREADRQYVPVILFGREWRVSNQLNILQMLLAAEGEAQGFVSFLMNCTHPDEQNEFNKALLSSGMMDEEGLLMICNALMSAIADFPTKSSSASSRSVKTRAASQK